MAAVTSRQVVERPVCTQASESLTIVGFTEIMFGYASSFAWPSRRI